MGPNKRSVALLVMSKVATYTNTKELSCFLIRKFITATLFTVVVTNERDRIKDKHRLTKKGRSFNPWKRRQTNTDFDIAINRPSPTPKSGCPS